jgi:UDP-N-acetylmuramate dehydrogenase
MTKVRIKENVPLKDLTTFRVGGEARYFVEVRGKDELVKAVNFSEEKDIPIFVLGGGSDILLSDDDFEGLILKYTGKKLEFKEENRHVLVKVEAGLEWDRLVAAAVEKGYQGIESMSGIPGTVGASPIQNIGAYGQELKDVFVELEAYDTKKKKFVRSQKGDCDFGYRESKFKKPKLRGRHVIISIVLRLNKGKKPEVRYESLADYLDEKGIKDPSLGQIRQAVLELRAQKIEDPEVIANAGSFFKNPIIERKEFERLRKTHLDIPFFEVEDGKIKLFSGWLIEKAGWKGKKYKNAAVSERNALVITNPKGSATAKEIKELAEKISEDVYRKFGIELEPEVQMINF